MGRKTAFLLLAVTGAVIPYSYFVPWLLQHGLNLRLFLDQLHANPVSDFFAADVIVSALAVIVLLIFERRSLGSRRWLPVIGLVSCGVSVGLPLLLYFLSPPVTRQDRPQQQV